MPPGRVCVITRQLAGCSGDALIAVSVFSVISAVRGRRYSVRNPVIIQTLKGGATSLTLAGKDFGQVQGLERQALAVDEARQMH
jgi:hypothetical protein